MQEQKQAFAEASNDAAFSADLLGKTYQSAMTKFGSIEGPVGDAIKQINTFGTVTDESTARMIAFIPGMDEQIRSSNARIKSAKTAEEAERFAAEEEMKIRALGAKLLTTQNGKFLAQIGMLDSGFQDYGAFALSSSRMITQLENINKDLGTDFETPQEAFKYISDLGDAVSDTIATLKKDGNLTSKSLAKAAKIDEKTAGLILSRMAQENVVGDFQSSLNHLIDGTDALIGVVDTLATGLSGALDKLFGDEIKETTALYDKTGLTKMPNPNDEKSFLMKNYFSPDNKYTDDYGIKYNKVQNEFRQQKNQDIQGLMGPDFQRRPDYAEEIKNSNKSTPPVNNNNNNVTTTAPVVDNTAVVEEIKKLTTAVNKQTKTLVTATEDNAQ